MAEKRDGGPDRRVPEETDTDFTESREQLRRQRKKRARRRLLRRLVIAALIAGIVWLFWNHWDTLAPDKLLARLQDSMNDTGGGFPVDISGANVHAIARTQNYFVTLGDSYLTYYSSKGSEINRYPCTYSSALLRTAGKYVLLAEQGGRRVQLTTRSMTLAEITTDQKILSAALCDNGRFAVLTQGGQGYAVQVTVYDRQGKTLYSRSRSRQATAMALSEDGSRLALLSIEATNGALNTVVEAFDLSSPAVEAQYTYTAADTLLYRLQYVGDRLAAVGENGLLLMRAAADAPVSYPIGSRRLLGFCAGGSRVALVLRDYGDTGGGSVVVLDDDGVVCSETAFDGDFRHLSVEGTHFLLLTDSYVQTIGAGGAEKRAAVESDGQQAVLCGDTAVVLGLSTLRSYIPA